MHNMPVHAKATKLLLLDTQLNRQRSRSSKQKKAAQQRAAYASQIAEKREYRRLQKANSRAKQSDEEWAAAKAKDHARKARATPEQLSQQQMARALRTATGLLADANRLQHKKISTNRKFSKVTSSLMVGVMFKIMLHMMEY